MKASIEVVSPIVVSPRTLQVQGIFDIPPGKKSSLRWEVDLPIESRPWNVGLIVGPSGCGKSTIARKLWPEEFSRTYEWKRDSALLDSFPAKMGVKEIVELLSSVGFSSPPSWLRPFSVLSNGEQFRATMARVLAEAHEVAVVDEFTSVVDRTVAQVGSAALAKTIRRRGQKFVAVTCHDDVEQWLQPDWVYLPAERRFVWREVQRRPPIELVINRVHHSEWARFKHHHYLTADISPGAFCFVAFWRGRPVAFDAWLPFFGKLKDSRKGRRGHRTVCLPDYQGVGIGAALFNTIAQAWAGLGFRAFSGTAHPAEIASRLRSGIWKMTRPPRMTAKGHHSIDKSRATNRLTAAFEFIGEPMTRARAHEVINTWASW